MTIMTKMTHAGEGVKLMVFTYKHDRWSTDQTSELLKDSLPAPNHVFASLPLRVYSP